MMKKLESLIEDFLDELKEVLETHPEMIVTVIFNRVGKTEIHLYSNAVVPEDHMQYGILVVREFGDKQNVN